MRMDEHYIHINLQKIYIKYITVRFKTKIREERRCLLSSKKSFFQRTQSQIRNVLKILIYSYSNQRIVQVSLHSFVLSAFIALYNNTNLSENILCIRSTVLKL
jgi:hypothetical protein